MYVILGQRDGPKSVPSISRFAYSNAAVEEGAEPTYVALPPEHPGHAAGRCGELRKHMYGTRAAADGWQQECSNYMKEICFTQGFASPCISVHAKRGLACSVHGDDFTSTGPKVELDWLEGKLESPEGRSPGSWLGRREGDHGPEPRAPFHGKGFEYEADPRQAERLLEVLQLDGEGCNSAAMPGRNLSSDSSRETCPSRKAATRNSEDCQHVATTWLPTGWICSFPARRPAGLCPAPQRYR